MIGTIQLLVRIKKWEDRLNDQQMLLGVDQNAKVRHITGGAGDPQRLDMEALITQSFHLRYRKISQGSI